MIQKQGSSRGQKFPSWKRRVWLLNASLVSAGCVSALLIGELFLRLIHFSSPLFYAPDPYTGWSHRPEAAGWFRQEGEAYVTINADGLRDRPHQERKPADTVRVAILGDSFAEAFQVPIEKTFWAILDRQLEVCHNFGSQKVEAINFGVAGYGTAQEFLTLRQHVWAYTPDIVLVALFTGNDIRNNSRCLEPKKQERPFYAFHDRHLELDRPSVNSVPNPPHYSRIQQFLWTISDKSRLVQFLYEVQQEGISSWFLKNSSTRLPLGEEIGLEEALYREPREEQWEEAWQLTEALLVAIRDEVKEHGARLLTVTLSNGIQVHPDPVVRAQFMQRVGVSDLFYPDRRIKAFGDQVGMEVLVLAPALQQYAEQHQVFLHGFPETGLGRGHWNEHGHRVAGELITQYLCAFK